MKNVAAAARLAVALAASLAVEAGARPALGAGAPSLEACLERLEAAPADPRSYYCFTESVRAHGRIDEAVRILEKVMAAGPGRHRARLNLALIEAMRPGPRAEQLFREAAEGMSAAGDLHGVVYAELALAARLGEQGRLDEADGAVARAGTAAAATADRELTARVLSARATQAVRRADPGGALPLFLEARTLAVPDGPADLQGDVLSGIAWVHWYLQDFREALRAYREEAEFRGRVADGYQEAAARYNVSLAASTLVSQGRMTPAEYESLLQEALEAAVRSGNATAEANVRLSLAQLLRGDPALEECERALQIANRAGNLDARLLAKRLAAQLGAGKDEDALEDSMRLLDEAMAEAAAAGSPFHAARGKIAKAYLAGRYLGREETIRLHLEAIEEVERMRARQPEGAIRARVLARWDYPYYRLSGYLIQGLDASPAAGEDLELAFRTMERGRARALLDALDAAGVSAGTPGSAALDAPEVPSLEQVRALLGADQALLAFQLWGEELSAPGMEIGESWMIVVTPERARAVALPARQTLEAEVEMFEGVLERGDGAERRPACRLYRDLLAVALEELPPDVTRLVVIPDGPLHRLAFGALRSDPEGEPLAARFEISLVPSATLWARWRVEDPRGAIPSLSFADPDPGSPAPASALRSAAPWIGRLGLGRLAHAGREARALARALGKGSQVLEGPRASEAFLKQADLGAFGTLHFAAHAVVDEAHPVRSAVLLAPGGDGEDGLLHSSEIADLPLRGGLVVLSACRSASGEVVGGEGVMGLARAFFQAGARVVVGSLRPLRDDDAAAFIEVFAREIGRGRSVARAAALASRARIAAGAPPAAFAGLVVLGDGDHVPVTGGGPGALRALFLGVWPRAVVALAVLAVAALALFLATRRPL